MIKIPSMQPNLSKNVNDFTYEFLSTSGSKFTDRCKFTMITACCVKLATSHSNCTACCTEFSMHHSTVEIKCYSQQNVQCINYVDLQSDFFT